MCLHAYVSVSVRLFPLGCTIHSRTAVPTIYDYNTGQCTYFYTKRPNAILQYGRYALTHATCTQAKTLAVLGVNTGACSTFCIHGLVSNWSSPPQRTSNHICHHHLQSRPLHYIPYTSNVPATISLPCYDASCLSPL